MKKNIIIIVLIIVFIAVTSFLAYKYINNKIMPNTSLEDTKESIKTKEVIFKNFTYTIPESYQYQYAKENKNMIVFFGENVNWDAYVELINNVTLDINDKQRIIYESLTNSGYSISEIRKETILGKSVLVMDYYNREVPAMIAYLNAAGNIMYEITIYDNNHSTFDKAYLNDLLSILIKAKYSE